MSWSRTWTILTCIWCSIHSTGNTLTHTHTHTNTLNTDKRNTHHKKEKEKEKDCFWQYYLLVCDVQQRLGEYKLYKPTVSRACDCSLLTNRYESISDHTIYFPLSLIIPWSVIQVIVYLINWLFCLFMIYVLSLCMWWQLFVQQAWPEKHFHHEQASIMMLEDLVTRVSKA